MQKIDKVAVLGAGTMGSGIAGICANAGCQVLLLDMQQSDCENARQRLLAGRAPVIREPALLERIRVGSFAADLDKIADCHWICEAVIEDVEIKRSVFQQVEARRGDGSIISSNTSGIPLKDLYRGMPERLQQDIAITHFFNPAHVMRLVELVAGEQTRPEVIQTLADFLGNRLDKGVVYAKDTVNFIGNRIGCFWMLAGLHHAEKAIWQDDLTIEMIDALMSEPLGFPATGLFGLVDLIGLDVMYNVGKNLQANLPADDPGRNYTQFTDRVQALYDRNQLGRKTGGGFYQLVRHDDGSKSMQTFDLKNDCWRPAQPASLADNRRHIRGLFDDNSAAARLVQTVMTTTLCYTAALVPEISNDIVNVDRAMRWGFGWKKGPFELMDALGADTLLKAADRLDLPVLGMLRVLQDAGAAGFYRDDNSYLTTDGNWAPLPA